MDTQQTQKFKITDIFFTVRFFLISAILAGIFFAFLAFISKNYTATETVLFSAKSEVAAQQQTQILSNMLELPHTLAFYDRMLKFNPDLTDFSANKTPQQRKRIWNSILQTKQVKTNASMIQISVSADNATDAAKLTSKTTRTLLDTMSLYYNVKNDIDLRIVDGPIVKSFVPMWPVLLFFSVVLAIAVELLLEYLFLNRTIAQSEIGREKIKSFFDFKKVKTQKEEENFSFEKTKQEAPQEFVSRQEKAENVSENLAKQQQTEQPDEFEMLNKIIEQETYPNYPEMPRHAQQKASAPDNLPIADVDLFAENNFEQEAESEEQASVQTSQQEVHKSHEPTAEEFKKRLNQLLKGEI